MKEIKDYLPYYLGCDYWTDNSQGNLNAHTLPNVIDMCRRGKGVQLHLRRLSDMTEQEMKALYRARTLWAYIQESYIKKIQFSEHNQNCITIDYEGPSGSNGYTCGHELMYLNQLMPDQFHYLLKQGFDLWGLIDNNLAVDAKTLNQQV